MTDTASTLAAPSTLSLVRAYLRAKRKVIEAGFASELQWQATRSPFDVTDVEFLREASWVVLSAGIADSVVARLFPRFADALFGFRPDRVCANPSARDRAMDVFGNDRKIGAVLRIAAVTRDLGTDGLRRELRTNGMRFIAQLPYMGPATTCHLAKNVGLQVAKPDRHLLRLSDATGRQSADALCSEISGWLGEPLSVVDIVLWRWATIHRGECDSSHCTGLPHN